MSDTPEIKALNNILVAKNELNTKLTCEIAIYRARKNDTERLQKSLEQNIKDCDKSEEYHGHLTQLKNEMKNAYNCNQITKRNLENRKTELESQLFNKRAQHAEKFASMDKTYEFYLKKCDEAQTEHEKTPLAVEKTKVQSQLKLMEFNMFLLKAKLDSSKKSLKLYESFKETRMQKLMIEFAQTTSDVSKNKKHIADLKKDISVLTDEVDSIENENKSVMMEIEELRRRKTDKLNAQSVINRVENSVKIFPFEFPLPPLHFSPQNIPMLELPRSLDEKSQDCPIIQSGLPDMNNYFDMKGLCIDKIKNFQEESVEEFYYETPTICTEKEAEGGYEDAKKPNPCKINIISNVTLNSEETEMILDEYIHKIPLFNKKTNMIVGERMIETDTKYEDIEENMGKNIKIPRKDGSNVFDDKIIENADMIKDTPSCTENEPPEASKMIPLHQEYVCVAKENVYNVTSPDLCLSKSKYFEKESSPVKIGFAHSTPYKQMHNSDYSMVEIQSEAGNMKENDQILTASEPTQAEMEVAYGETPKCIMSLMDASAEPGCSSDLKRLQRTEAMPNFLKHRQIGSETQNSNDFIPNSNFLNNNTFSDMPNQGMSPKNYESSMDFESLKMESSFGQRLINDMANQLISPKNNENSMDFENFKLRSSIGQRIENVSENASSGFVNIFKKNTSEAAMKDNENKPAFHFNFSAQENKKFSSFSNVFN